MELKEYQKKRIEEFHGKLILLSVGIDNYGERSGFPPLKTCSNDAKDIKEAFLNTPQLNADKNRLLQITSDDQTFLPSKGNIFTSIKQLVEESKEDDRLLFYFSGHGHRLKNEEIEKFYLVPQDAYDDSDPDCLVDFDKLIDMIDNSFAKHKIVIIDACFSGPVISGKKLHSAKYSVKAIEKHLKNTEGFVTLCSSKNNQTSTSKSPNDRNSLFTYFVVKALLGETVALDSTNILTVSSLFDYVNTEVRRTSNSYQGNQIPSKTDTSTGEIILGIFAENSVISPLDVKTESDKLELAVSFSNKLNDPGASFFHPNKTNLQLNDFFIYPYLRDLTRDSEENVNSENLLIFDENENRILILGDQNSGKTSLCKVLYMELYNKGYIPIYFNGKEITSKYVKNFDSLLLINLSEQYNNDFTNNFIDTNLEKIVLIIDDYNKAKLNIKFKSIFLNYISQKFEKLIISSNDIYQVCDLVLEECENSTFINNFKQYEILDFGNLLRYKLINKWNSIEREEIIDSNELINKNDRAKLIIDTVIGKNFVPAYPVYILTLLHTIEAGIPHNLKESSYGYYYQCLITNAISKINKSNEEIDAYYNYITELAYYLFLNEIYELSNDDLKKFHSDYCKEYSISLNYEELTNNLQKANILWNVDDMFRFRYKYIRYFFTAKYLSNEISDEDIKEKISFMCKNLHNEHFANIIMFLTHHSKDPFIIYEIINNAKILFSECDPFVFDNHIDNINKLMDSVPKAVYENRNVHEHRENRLKNIDEIEKRNNWDDEIIEEDDTHENIEDLDIVSKLNLTFKTIEIIGQILKNYYGSLKGVKKYELAQESYFLGLRALSLIFTEINQNTENIIKQISKFIEKKNIVDKIEIEKVSRKLFFRICEFIAYGFIKKISNSVGYEKLSETFKQILENNNQISISLVDISIKLDFYSGFPNNDLKSLTNILTKHTLPYTLVRQMVINYLYMFPTDYRQKSQICNQFNISMKDQRLIDHKSVQKKRKK